VRVDKWLWAARFYKSRSAATAACEAGRVKLDGLSVRASRLLRGGERLRCLTLAGERVVEVAGLAERRGPAAVARELYVDHTPPPPPRETLSIFESREQGAGRPTKRQRRDIERLRGRRR
jgi:ribosome-associated heat shock protein Hsp15